MKMLMEPIISDAIVLDFQNKYYRGAPANSFEPLANSVKRVLEEGMLLNEVCYSPNYPNSFADIYYTDSDLSVKRPTILYHYGGWFMGSRTDGTTTRIPQYPSSPTVIWATGRAIPMQEKEWSGCLPFSSV